MRVVAAGALLLLATAGDAVATPPVPAAIEADAGACGTGWRHPHPGRQTLMLRNTGSTVAEVALIDPRTGAIHAELENLAPDTTRPMRVTLGGGTYAFRCTQEGGDPVVGPPALIGGTARGGPAIVPVTENDLYGPVRSYQAYVARGLARLTDRTAALRAAVARGDLAAARDAWLSAHLAYERLGAAYGTFGDFDGEINGRPAGLPGGVHDKGFTGFHRVEYGLWHGESAASLATAADRLDHDVRALRADFPDERIDPGDLPLRAHEILENTLQFQLTGEADQGSGTTLRTAAANIEGTREVLSVLRPLLTPRYPALPAVDDWLNRVSALLTGRSSVESLSTGERERLNGATGQLLELLAPVATIGEPRRVS